MKLERVKLDFYNDDMVDPNITPENIRTHMERADNSEFWSNDDIWVQVMRGEAADEFIYEEPLKGRCSYISVREKMNDPNAPEHIFSWSELQAIKNIVMGPGCEAIELYPDEDRTVRVANIRHLFVFPKGYRIPFGFAVTGSVRRH